MLAGEIATEQLLSRFLRVRDRGLLRNLKSFIQLIRVNYVIATDPFTDQS